MNFNIKSYCWNSDTLNKIYLEKYECIITAIFHDELILKPTIAINKNSNGIITRIINSNNINYEPGSTFMLYEIKGENTPNVLIINFGKYNKINEKIYKKSLKSMWSIILKNKFKKIICSVTEIPIQEYSCSLQVKHAIISFRNEFYNFIKMKKYAESNKSYIKDIIFTVSLNQKEKTKVITKQSIAIANGIDLARDLGNLPGNICTPQYLETIANNIAKEWQLNAKILHKEEIEENKMNAFLSVAKGSSEAPRFIILYYLRDDINKRPIVLVGKGITFDSGGISLKIDDRMHEMKYDMCGAAAVLGTIRAIAEIGVNINVIGVIPACENMPSGNAIKPGDIITSMSGKTIEIINTDAEGRLILCDALTYVKKFNPIAVIDIATLTGACVIALGDRYSGLFSKNKILSNELFKASQDSSDLVWKMPIDEEYQEKLKSHFADISNVGGREAGSITAACFLSNFADSYPWAHIDIAGTAWNTKYNKGATGRPVSLLTQFLINKTL